MSKLERSTFVHAVGKYIRNIFKLLSYTNVKKQSFKKKTQLQTDVFLKTLMLLYGGKVPLVLKESILDKQTDQKLCPQVSDYRGMKTGMSWNLDLCKTIIQFH